MKNRRKSNSKFEYLKLQIFASMALALIACVILFSVWTVGSHFLFGIPLQLLLVNIALPVLVAILLFIIARKFEKLAWLDEDDT